MSVPRLLPTATYRLQFNQQFTFRAATELVAYLAALGISHVYASPFFRAAPGSSHGYDVCDHNALNPEVGSTEEFQAFVAALKEHGLGLIVDFVPNHMGIDRASNPWWRDVLENGPSSPFARFFDIDWQPLKRELENKVLLPVLGDQYGRILEHDEFQVEFCDGAFQLRYWEFVLPIAPRTTLCLLRKAAGFLDPAPAELESIITAIEHLPSRTETTPQKVTERMRERQIIRDRLRRLCQEVTPVRESIDRTLGELHNRNDSSRFDRLDELIQAQPYRLSSWRVAAEEINYRRFFDVNTLAAIRMELPEVFEATHRLLLQLIADGVVTGVRIDHIDGLARPQDYLQMLQRRAAEVKHLPDQERPLYLLVEKILGAGEKLRTEWPVHGTTGYEFANDLTHLLVNSANASQLTSIYEKFIGFRLSYSEVAYRSKRLVMQVALASEVNVLGSLLNRISESNRWYRDFTVNALTTAVREVIACFPVYRTYIDPDGTPDSSDIRVIDRALAQARKRNPAFERTVFEFLRNVLIPPENNSHPVDEELRREFVLKFQQCTGPITAKGVEDTAFYVFNRLVALNEVGGEPSSIGAPIDTFHANNADRLANFPYCLLATSTHDTKRSEDVRARIAAISELPDEWGRALRRWQTLNQKHRQEIDGELAPDPNEEFLLYQTLAGSWPLEPLTPESLPAYVQRIQDYFLKALHEAKVNTSWVEPHSGWDRAAQSFVAAILDPSPKNRFTKSFAPFAEKIARLGAINSLSQTLLKLTCPGVPDFYQGSELWDLSLVDPDNRRPVDYMLRQRHLVEARSTSPAELMANWHDGKIKAYTIHRVLEYRHNDAALFQSGAYVPLQSTGKHSQSVVAFERSYQGRRMIVVAPRLSAAVGFPPVGECWEDTELHLAADGQWRDIFTGQILDCSKSLRLADVLGQFPIAALVSQAG